MNAVAWEPVIKEKHWFGEHEFYESPLIGHEDKTGIIKDNTFQWIGNWTLDASSQYHDQGNGKIGEYKVVNISTVSEATADDQHAPMENGQRKEEYCIGLEARWKSGYVSYHQTTEEQLPAGTYALTYDVMNGDSATTKASYVNLFYVEVNGNKTYDPRTEWMNGGTKWTTHTIVFTLNSAAQVKINLGFAMGENNDIEQKYSPALYVSHLKLEQVNSTVASETHINWSGSYIESINVVKGWTGKEGDERQCPKKSFYSWLDHKLRFSVDDINKWYLGRNGKHENVLGLMNMSGNDAEFTIHDLKAGDKFNIEYYRHAVEVNANNTIFPTLVSGNVDNVSPGNVIAGADANGLVYYTMSGNGDVTSDVTIKIPHNTLIRSVTIEHNDYKKATYTTEPITKDGKKGYKTTMTGPGVLEEKYGAIPYLTMRYGAMSDMTIVRDLGNGEFAASCVIDENNTFKPGDDGAKFMLPHRNMTEEHLKDWFAGKDWSVFTANIKQNDEGKWINDQASLVPLYGSYYYFFPEVKGQLKVRFYCEGKNEHMPFWNKTTGWYGLGSHDSDGSNIYEYEGTVQKGNVYYLCSNPNSISHEHNTIRLISYSFIPDFSIEPLYKVVNNTTDIDDNDPSNKIIKVAEILGGPYEGLDTDSLQGTFIRNTEEINKVQCLGNVKSAKVKVYTEDDNRQYLGFSDIKFWNGTNTNGEAYNPGGAIVAHLSSHEYGEANFVLTIAYDAANAKWGTAEGKETRVANTDGGIEVKRWDFYSGKGDYDFTSGQRKNGWDIGKYGTADDGDVNLYVTNPDAWNNRSKLFKEVNKADGLKADWQNMYVNMEKSEERIFKSVYDMEGDNADMIHETAGLVFHVGANQLGIWNENPDPESSFQDRYLGLMGGGKLVIPRLKQNDRVVIKMGSYGNCDANIANEPATIKLTNAKDAMGTQIPSDAEYVIGGSIPYATGTTDDVTIPHGEYHFKVASTSTTDDTDFAIEVTEDTKLLKIYSIEIYRNAANNNADILTENEVKGNKNEILYTADVNGNKSSAETIDIQLRYNGKNEPKSYFAPAEGDKANYTGTFRNKDVTDVTFTSSGDTYTYTPANTDFGAFKARMGVKTTDNAYVTDYADRYMAVGYRETKPYPYTWDFTDLRSYVGTQANHDYLSPELSKPVSEWGSTTTYDYALHLTTDKSPGVLFASGSQLYAGANVFEESAGIGFKRDENLSLSELKAYDEGLQLLTDGLKLDCPNNNDYRLVIPQVGANAAVYVRATPLDGVSSKCSTDGTSASTWTEMATASDGDKIYAYKNDSSDPVDIELWLNHMTIRKIAVATDEKTVNNFGWNTESRDHAIDPSLTAYMTGKDFRTYIVTDADVEKNTVTLVRIDGGSEDPNESNADNTAENWKLIVPAATNGSVNACIVRYVDKDAPENEQTVNIFDDGKGFHLFVPDMHDAANNNFSGNLLKAQVSNTDVSGKKVPRDETIGSQTYNNYAFTNKHRNVVMGGDWKYDVQAFYRIVSGGAGSYGNQAYLSIPGSGNSASRSAEPANSSAVPQTYDIVFKDWSDLMTEKGAVNGDGMVTRPDIDVLSGYVTARYSNGLFKRMGDMNDDGRIDIVDMTLLIKKIMSE